MGLRVGADVGGGLGACVGCGAVGGLDGLRYNVVGDAVSLGVGY
jgi:hypothetical protein